MLVNCTERYDQKTSLVQPNFGSRRYNRPKQKHRIQYHKRKKTLWCNCNGAKDGINAKIYRHLVGTLNIIDPEDPHQNEEISTLF